MRPCKRCPTCSSWMLCVWGKWRHFDVDTQRWLEEVIGCPHAEGIANAAHVIPRGDLIQHETNDECACGPTLKPVERDDGSIGWVHTHHSLDGREKDE